MKQIILVLLFFYSISISSQQLRLGVPVGNSGIMNSANYICDEKFIFSQSTKNVVLWDVETSASIQRYSSFGEIKFAKINPQNTKILISNYSNTFHLLDIISGKEELIFCGHSDMIIDGMFSPNGEQVLSVGADNTVRVYDLLKQKEIFVFKGSYAIYSRSGSKILIGNGSSVITLDSSNGKVIEKFKANYGIFSTDEKKVILLKNNDKSLISKVYIGDIASGKEIHLFDANLGKEPYFKISPDGKKLITIGYKTESWDMHRKVQVWDFGLSKLLFELSDEFINSVEFSGDSNEILTTSGVPNTFLKYSDYYESENVARIWDLNTGEILHSFLGHKDRVVSAIYSRDGNKVLTSSDDLTSIIWDKNTEFKIKLFSGKSFELNSVDFNSNSSEIVISSSDASAMLLDINSGKISKKFEGHSSKVNSAVFSPDGKSILTASDDSTVRIWSIETGFEQLKLLPKFRHGETGLEKAIYNLNGDLIMLVPKWSTPLLIVDTKYGNTVVKLVPHQKKLKIWRYLDFTFAKFNHSTNKVISISGDLIDRSFVSVFNAKTGDLLKTIYAKKGYLTSIDISPNDSLLIMATRSRLSHKLMNNSITVWDLLLGRELYTLETQNGGFNSVIFSPSGKSALTIPDNGDSLHVIDMKSKKIIFSLDGNGTISAKYSPDEKWICSITNDGRVVLFNAENGKKIIESIFLEGDPDKWVHVHPSGIFDASAEAMEMMYFISDLEVIGFTQLKDRFWLPDLWKKVMNGEALPEIGVMQALKFYPDVSLESTSLEDISINLTKRDGGYGVVKVFLNGKEINSDARGTNFNNEAINQIIKINIKDHPYLINGKNEIKVVASSENGIDSRGVVVSILNDTVEFSEPHFYGVIIGIGEYANSSINLKFSVQDAVGISKAITIAANNLFKERSHIYTLTSKDKNLPNKENIKEVFENISKNAKSDDIIFVYLAGHGISTSGNKGDFYFLTSDAKSANNDSYQDEIIRQTSAISSNEFVEWIKNIPALKQVMIIDACGSGKAVDNLVSSRDIEPSQLKAIDRMKDRTGMFIISGCAADAVSYEASQYGQGLLTYSLLQAMKGAALKENKYVDVNTILSFARDEVPKLANGIGGIQTPQLLIPKSGSFDIGILEDSDKIEIPLAKAKTVFVRSSLVESNEDDDILNISALLDDRLSQISARGNASKIVFFDSRMYPQSCKISGGYYKKEDRIYVNLKIRCGELISEHKVEAENLEKLIDNIIKIVEEN